MQPHGAEEYAHQLRSLQPPGKAWHTPSGSVGDLLLQGEAEELARIDARAIRLVLYEFFAQSTRELLPEWELEYGLPEPCRQLGATFEERIEDLLRKIRAIGGQSIAYFVELAESLGINITITEFRPFRAGISRAGDRVFSREWQFVFLVNGPVARTYRFRAGRSRAGDRLRFWRNNELLECIINHYKPAHTYAMFNYSGDDHHFLMLTEPGGVALRNDIEPNSPDAIHEVTETGGVRIRPGLRPGDGNDYMYVDEKGNLVLRNDIGD